MSQHRILKYVCSNQGYCDDDPDAIPGKRRVERFHYIVYAPNNEFTNKLMAQVQDILDVDVSKNSSRFVCIYNYFISHDYVILLE